MPQMPQGYRCRPLETGRFLVGSASRGAVEHMVDCLAWNGYGACSCEHFTFRLLPELRRGRAPGKRCSHISAAREAFLDDIIGRMNAHLTPHGHDHDPE